MNLSDMLGYADIQQLSRIADVYQCECNGNSKNDLIQSILSTVGRKDVFEDQISSMKLEDLRFLNSLLFDVRESFSLEDLIARVQQCRFGEQADKQEIAEVKSTKRRKKKNEAVAASSSPREIIAQFKYRGWLFNGFSGPSRYLFQVPLDMKLRFREALKNKFAAQLQYTDEPPFYRDEQMLLQEDVTQFLRYVYHNDVQLTADGSMYKRFTVQVLEKLAVQEQLPAKAAWRFGYGRYFNHYPNRFSFLYDYCYHSRWLSEQEAALTVTQTGEKRMAACPPDEAERQYRFWLHLYKGPISQLLSVVQWINALAEQWVTVDSLKSVLVPYIKPYYYDDANAIMEQRILAMMLHLGLLRLGEHPLYGAVVRMTKAGNAIVSGHSLSG